MVAPPVAGGSQPLWLRSVSVAACLPACLMVAAVACR